MKDEGSRPARWLVAVVFAVAFAACARAEEPAEHRGFASACRQLEQADALVAWVRLDTAWQLRKTGGYDEGFAYRQQGDAAGALAFEMLEKTHDLVAAGNREIADRISDAGLAVFDLGQTLDQLAYIPVEKKLEAVRSAVAAVNRAVNAAYRTFTENIAPCAWLRPEGA